MICFVDTSAFLAILDGADENHGRADETMRRLEARDAFVFDPHFAEQGFNCHPG